jgi:hypothetical protein
MTVTVRMIEPGILRIEWPGRLTQEVRDTLFWVLDAIDGVDAIWHGNYTTELQTAAHLVDTRLVAALVGNALLDDERLAEFLSARGWGDLEIRTAP